LKRILRARSILSAHNQNILAAIGPVGHVITSPSKTWTIWERMIELIGFGLLTMTAIPSNAIAIARRDSNSSGLTTRETMPIVREYT
jgi:hypothetical protein